jgi:hypothetical protein
VPSPGVGVLVVHGMGIQNAGYSGPLEVNTRGHLAALGLPEHGVVFLEGLWADLLQGRETELWRRLSAAEPLDYGWLRRFVISALGDAIAYRPVPTTRPTTYHAIHWRLFELLQALREKLPAPTCPLVLVGHSLGTVILSDHVWDEQQGQGHGRDAFTRTDTLGGFVTFGSTLPLFTLGLEQIVAIDFPGSALTPAQRSAARWLNFFDRDDVLAYPLRPTSPTYRTVVARDTQLNVGNILTSWNPLSHTGYWASDRLALELARVVRDLAIA